jgi:hypothetical protein
MAGKVKIQASGSRPREASDRSSEIVKQPLHNHLFQKGKILWACTQPQMISTDGKVSLPKVG